MHEPVPRSFLAAAFVWTIVCLIPGAAVSTAWARELPHLHLETLERTSPGWVPVESTGDAKAGRVVVERVVWPLFYLHWRPLTGQGGVGDKLTVPEAERAVAGLWDGMTFDKPLEGRRISLPAHEGVVIETTTNHGEWKSRYFVWACPESGRLFIADTNASLLVNAPAPLLDLMADMARTVRCHENAKIDDFPALKKRREVEETDVSYGLPFGWSPIEAYRVQKSFAGADFVATTHPTSTRTEGQDLVLELGCLRRLYVTWEPGPDAAMTFDMLIERVHAFWKERSINLLPSGTRVINDVWIMDGLVKEPMTGMVPPSRLHKFRAWMWRKEGVSYMAVGDLGGIRFGARVMTQVQGIADQLLEEMFESIDY